MNTDRFKFRVWSNIRKAYCPETIYIDQQGKMCRPALDDDKEYVIEQCTGLRDKNGTLIYEGDIVEAVDDNRKKTYEVKYEPRSVGFLLVSEKFYERYIGVFHADEIEVVGNIHEWRGEK